MKANDTLREYWCTEHYHRFTSDMLLTDGAKALADNYNCYWLIDIIWSYQHKTKLRCDGFQVWKLKKTGQSAVVWCEDGNENKIVSQQIPYTDFAADEAELWVESNVVLLPSEH